MTFELGQPKVPGSGRKPGTPNKRTAALSNALVTLAEEQVQNLGRVMNRIYEEDRRANAILKLLALVTPKGGLVLPEDDADSTAAIVPAAPQSVETTE